MSDIYQSILETLEKLPAGNDELKTSIKGLAQNLNQEKGKALSDLNQVKANLEKDKDEKARLQNENTAFKELSKHLTELGIDTKNIDKIASKLKIEKTATDELDTFKALHKREKERADALEQEKTTRLTQDKVDGVLKTVLEKFIDPKEGKPYRIIEDFIDKTTLYKPLNTEEPALVEERVKQALTAAYEKQKQFQEKYGLDFTSPLHKVNPNLGGSNPPNGKFDKESAFKEIREAGGIKRQQRIEEKMSEFLSDEKNIVSYK